MNVGDDVKIIDCQRNGADGISGTRLSGMAEYIGTVSVIEGISKANNKFYYFKNNAYGWHEDWLEIIIKDIVFIEEDEMRIG